MTLLLSGVTMAMGTPNAQAQTSSAQSTSSQTARIQAADSAFREGYAASQRNDLAAARIGFEKAVRLAPGLAVSHAALGSVLLALADYPAAVRELEEAQRLDRTDIATLLNLCVAYSDSHDYPKSIATFHEIEAAPNAPPALPPDAAIAAATAFSASSQVNAAESVLQRSLQALTAAGQDSAGLQDALGTVMAQKQDFTEAEVHLRRAIATDESLAAAHFHLGSVETVTNRSSEALPELARAHTLDPGNLLYTIELAKTLTAGNQEAQAIDLLRSTLAKLNPSTVAEILAVKYQLALTLQSAGNAKEAAPLFADVISARPDDAEALTNAALDRVQLGDAKGAIPLYLRALKLTPSNPTLREDLGVAFLQQADVDHAIEQFRAGLAVDDQSPQLHYDLGFAYKLKDDLSAAVPEFKRAAELDPRLPDPPYTLGIIYMQQGQFEKSAASFEQATILRPGNADAWATLGSVYQQMQQPEKAIPALRQAIALAPEQPSPHITLAAALSAQGHKDEAASERKIGAALTRAVVDRQKANFGLDSGNVLMKRGQTDDALVQFQSAVEADPAYIAPHIALANALDRAGRKAEAAEERRKADELQSAVPAKSE